MDIKTFVFFDLETTGLPSQENNQTRITELCLTAVQTDHLGTGVYPRIQSKLSLCFNPKKVVDPIAVRLSGLSNDLLKQQPEFDGTTFGMIDHFLNMLCKPICLVAHNGNQFDYPILHAEIHKTGNSLPEEVLCIDSLNAFKELHFQELEGLKVDVQPTAEEVASTVAIANGNGKKRKNKENNIGTAHGKRFGPSFKLKDLYKRLIHKRPTNAHKAEHDVQMLIECAAAVGQRFVGWANTNAKLFCDMPMMTPGKKIGT